jgi:hypothetical protein
VASGAGVVLATTGLSTCRDGGAVDPPPPPFDCTAGVGAGQSLRAAANLAGRELRVSIANSSLSTWAEVRVESVVRPLFPGSPLDVVIDLAGDTVTSGSFVLSGTLRGLVGSALCPVSRAFTFTILPTGVEVALAEDLPLSERRAARIVLVSRQGREVELEAVTGFEGTQAFSWNVTGGEVLARDGHRLRWRMPAAAGLYQVEVVVDYGSRGLSFDALALEVA